MRLATIVLEASLSLRYDVYRIKHIFFAGIPQCLVMMSVSVLRSPPNDLHEI